MSILGQNLLTSKWNRKIAGYHLSISAEFKTSNGSSKALSAEIKDARVDTIFV